MNDDLQTIFQTHQQQLSESTVKLEQVIPEKHLVKLLADIRHNLQQEHFRLVILGQFKRGKSTFINALLGQTIVPTDVIPVTAVITEIHYGPVSEAQVYFLGGSVQTIPLDQVDQYVSESQNPKNQKKVDKIAIYHPAEMLKNGVILVDTPGVGSIHEHNTRLTQEYLVQADAAIFIFSADPPLTELEQNFLKVIIPIVPQIFFVLNKSDYLSPEHLQKVLDFNQVMVQQLLGKDAEIFPISALHGLQAKLTHQAEHKKDGLARLEDNLNHFLVHDRGKYLLLSNIERILRVCQEWKNLVDLDQKAQTLSLEELAGNLQRFTTYMTQIKRESERMKFLLDEIKTRLLNEYDRQTHQFIVARQATIRQKLEELIAGNRKTSKRQFLQSIQQALIDLIIDEFEPYRLRIEKTIKEQYRADIQQLNHTVNQIISRIYQFSAELFHLSQIMAVTQDVWRYESRFFYRTWEVEVTLELIQNLLLLLLPRPVFLALQKRKVTAAIKGKLEQRWGEFRGELVYGLSDNNRLFLSEFQELLERIHTEISQLIHRHIEAKETGEKSLEARFAEQERILQNVNQVIENVTQIKMYWKNLIC